MLRGAIIHKLKGNILEIMETEESVISFNGASKMLSYGGKTFGHNLEEAKKAIEKVKPLERIFDRSRSQFTLKTLTCSNADDWLRLRQISAEMHRKRTTLIEVQFGYMEKQVEIKILERDLKDKDDLEGDLAKIQIARLKSQSGEILIKVEGAMKEVQTLAQMHDSLVERMGDITEEAFEKAQVKSHIKRAMVQSIRDVRSNGMISIGDQEYLEQCGVCVTTAFKEIKMFLQGEDKANSSNTSLLHVFIEDFASRYEGVITQQAEWLGFQREPDLGFTWAPEESCRE